MIREDTAEQIWYGMVGTLINLDLEKIGFVNDIVHLQTYVVTYCRLHPWVLGVEAQEDEQDQSNVDALHELLGYNLSIYLFNTYERLELL